MSERASRDSRAHYKLSHTVTLIRHRNKDLILLQHSPEINLLFHKLIDWSSRVEPTTCKSFVYAIK
jgi:hypothetical protein